MATPVNPTLTSLSVEVLKSIGYSDPATNNVALLTRCQDEWLEEIKGDIMNTAEEHGNTRLKTLLTTDIQISVDNQSSYNFPSDFDEEVLVELLISNISVTGTAQAGGTDSLTLAAADTMTQVEAEGKYLLITSGTSNKELRQITAFNTTTKVATVASNWDTTPDNTSVYAVIDYFKPIDEDDISEWPEERTSPGEPEWFYKIEEGVNTKLHFDVPFDSAIYGIRIRYYANIHEVDLVTGSTLMSKIYKNWASVLKQGMRYKALANDNRPESDKELTKYNTLLGNLIRREISWGGAFTGFEIYG